MKKERPPPTKKQRIAIEHNWQLLMAEGCRRNFTKLLTDVGLYQTREDFDKLCDLLVERIKMNRVSKIAQVKETPSGKR